MDIILQSPTQTPTDWLLRVGRLVATSGELLGGLCDLLEAQGLRATSRGGHIAVQEAVTAQFGAAVSVFRSFGRIRRARNAFEYPSSSAPGPAAEDIDDAVRVATQAHSAAGIVLDQQLLTPWQPRPEAGPG